MTSLDPLSGVRSTDTEYSERRHQSLPHFSFGQKSSSTDSRSPNPIIGFKMSRLRMHISTVRLTSALQLWECKDGSELCSCLTEFPFVSPVRAVLHIDSIFTGPKGIYQLNAYFAFGCTYAYRYHIGTETDRLVSFSHSFVRLQLEFLDSSNMIIILSHWTWQCLLTWWTILKKRPSSMLIAIYAVMWD